MRALAVLLFCSCLGCNAVFGIHGGELDTGMIHI
jgi:hypothetical protein